MKNLLALFLFAFLLPSCHDDCMVEEKTLATGERKLDSDNTSLFFGQTVLDFYYTWKAKVESGETCKSSTCIETTSMRVINLSPQDMDLTLTLAGRGDFTFSLIKGDTISINPLPDYCINNSWGSVKSIVYK